MVRRGKTAARKITRARILLKAAEGWEDAEIAETRTPLPARPGQPERYDYEYGHHGTCNIFLHCEPQAGWRHLAITAQCTKQDFAAQLQWLVDARYPEEEFYIVSLILL
jgi:hypothetical protein